eukprot:COSAG02_NODE_16970_length_1039_cov_1.506383_1_plen_51_part_10
MTSAPASPAAAAAAASTAPFVPPRTAALSASRFLVLWRCHPAFLQRLVQPI